MNVETVMGGLVGLCLVIVGILSFVIKWFCGFINTTLKHNSEVTTQNTKATKANVKSNENLTAAVSELNVYFRALNGKLIPKK